MFKRRNKHFTKGCEIFAFKYIFETIFTMLLYDLVHKLETTHDLYYLLTASENLFRNMSDAQETADHPAPM